VTFGDQDSIDDEVVAALRADARTGVPHGSRERILRRLGIGAGVLGATASVTTGAGALVAGAIATHSTAVLVSTLAIGIGIGFGAHSGLDAIRAPDAPVATVPVSSPASATAAVAPRVPVDAPVAVPSVVPTAAPPEAATEGAMPAPRREPPGHAEPTNAAPASLVAVPVLDPPSLAAQQSLLDDARSALLRRDGASALSAIGAHRLRFPDTALAEERAALEIRALLGVGRMRAARERHAVFERAFPGSLFASSLRQLFASGAPDSESVTDPPADSQLKE
jgi:hypothetical protein